MNNRKPKLFLHACCASCITYPYTTLSPDYEVTVFFYNPNIHPQKEYNHRLESVKKLAEKWRFDLIIASYDTEKWFTAVKGLEECKEGGNRCLECFRLRLEKTAETAKERDFDFFATTLTISPLKDAEVINRIGISLEEKVGINYLRSNFKKRDGFKKSCQLSQQEDLYRQNYCGCVYSRREK